jgi:hypothetical protein
MKENLVAGQANVPRLSHFYGFVFQPLTLSGETKRRL